MAKALRGKWGDLQTDLSLLKYADDLNKFIVATEGMTFVDFLDKISEIDALLNDSLSDFGLAQNMSKQECLFYFSGAGSHYFRKLLRAADRFGLAGVPKEDA
eukprot:5346081-Pyramimonas_sp.AAC.1